MDGFNAIPIDKNISTVSSPIVNTTSGDGVEIIQDDSSAAAKKTKSGGLTVFLSLLALVAVIGYFLYLVFSRISMLNEITSLGEQLSTIGKNIDKGELEDFRAMDKKLGGIGSKLGSHTLNSQVFLFVNNNIRNTLQVTEYRLDVKGKDVEVVLTAVAPSFKEFAEQTEKLFQLKEAGSISSFTITSLSFESDTKRLRFTAKLVFDRSTVSALSRPETNNQKN